MRWSLVHSTIFILVAGTGSLAIDTSASGTQLICLNAQDQFVTCNSGPCSDRTVPCVPYDHGCPECDHSPSERAETHQGATHHTSAGKGGPVANWAHPYAEIQPTWPSATWRAIDHRYCRVDCGCQRSRTGDQAAAPALSGPRREGRTGHPADNDGRFRGRSRTPHRLAW